MSLEMDKVSKEFQFTPLREGRREGHTMSELMSKFQFTPLREGRPPHRASRDAP